MKASIILCFILTISSQCSHQKEQAPSYSVTSDSNGLVPDSETAKRIAEAVWIPIYGESVLEQKPYSVSLVGDSVWIVKGTLKKNLLGGTAYIEIKKDSCKILKVTHGK